MNQRPAIPLKASRLGTEIDPEIRAAGKLKRTKAMIAAGTRLFWLKRGIREADINR